MSSRNLVPFTEFHDIKLSSFCVASKYKIYYCYPQVILLAMKYYIVVCREQTDDDTQARARPKSLIKQACFLPPS